MAVFAILFAFIASAIAGYMAGLVGSSNNPTSGVTVSILLITSLILLGLGFSGTSSFGVALLIATVIACCAAISGDVLQSMTAGQMIGATPWKQQVAELVGICAAAPVLAFVVQALHKAYERGDNIQGLICPGSIGRPAKSSNIFQMSKTYRTDWIYYLTQDICEKFKDTLELIIEPVPIWFCDNLAFEKYGFTSTALISGPSEIKDHCPEDDIDRINFSYLTRITKLMLMTTDQMANKPIDVQVQFVTPKEGFFYFTDNVKFKNPLTKTIFSQFQGMTYIRGNRITASINITSDEEISNVIYSFDTIVRYNDVILEPPYDLKIQTRSFGRFLFKGKHTLGVTVTTVNGNTAYDEMDIFII